MSFEISGLLAEKYETQQVNERFKKREFVLEIKSTGNTGYEFVDFIKFQATQDKCSMLDSFNVDDQVKVSFNLRGRKWERDGQVTYFTNLEAWRIEAVQSEQSADPSGGSSPLSDFSTQDAPFPTDVPPPASDDDPGIDDLPF